jgi:hypothetical protein
MGGASGIASRPLRAIAIDLFRRTSRLHRFQARGRDRHLQGRSGSLIPALIRIAPALGCPDPSAGHLSDEESRSSNQERLTKPGLYARLGSNTLFLHPLLP